MKPVVSKSGPPLDVDDGLAEALKIKLQQLDEDHARARTPKQRRRIEREMQAARAEVADIIAKGKKVDVSFQRWVASANPVKGNA